MARLHSTIGFLGTLDNLTAYKIMGSDQIYLRRKGGPSASQVKNSPKFETLRRAQSEFGGRATVVSSMTPIFAPVKHIANFPITGQLGALLKPAQDMDTTSLKGQRHVLLSANPHILEGFNLNNRYSFESVIRNGFSYSIAKDAMYARVSIPSLVPGNNLYVPDFFDWYQVKAVLGIIPDHIYSVSGYKPAAKLDIPAFTMAETNWFVAKEGSAAAELELTLPPASMTSFSLMLVAGISFGKAAGLNYIKAVKHAGAGKIVGME